MNIFAAASPQLGYYPPASSTVTTGSCTVATFTTTLAVTKPAIYTTTQTVTATPFTTTSTITIPLITTVTQPFTTTATTSIVSTLTVPITTTVTRPVTTTYTQQTTVGTVSTTSVTVPITTTIIKPVTITNTVTFIDPITTTVTLTATPSPSPSHQCNNGPILCCDQVQEAGLLGAILGLLGIILSDVEGLLIGVTCVPLSTLGGNIGSKQPVCCDNDNYGGLVAIGCTPYPYAL